MDNLRIFLHIVSASIWVGGQITMAAIAGPLRTAASDAPKTAARAFNKVAWPAFVLAVITGIWNLVAGSDLQGAHPELEIKFLLVLVSAAGAAMHITARGNKMMLAVGGALTLVGGLGAMYAGVVLAPLL